MSTLPPLHVVESADPLATPRRVALVRPTSGRRFAAGRNAGS